MNKILLAVIAGLIGTAIGLSLTYIFNKLPEKWLQDYDYDEKAPDFRLAKRMKVVPHGLLAAASCALFYILAVIFCYDLYLVPFKPIHLAVILFAMPVIFMVAVADRLNRIIPDEFPLFLLVLGFVALAADFVEGTIWFSEECAWYHIVLHRVIGLLIGGGFLWLIGFISETFLGREAMGQGDVKLLGACGFLVGYYGLIVLIYAAVFSAVFFAIPMMIRKIMRKKAEEKEIRSSKDPIKARREIAKRKAEMHFADDPDYLAFGPFLAYGAAVFLTLEPLFTETLLSYSMGLGVYR